MVSTQNLKTSVSFTGDGTTKKFYFGFDYLNKQFIKVQLGDEGTILNYPTDYTVEDRYVILKDTPAVGVSIRIYRETSSDRIIEWVDGAFIKASQMKLENLQQLHLIEESQDYPIINSLSKYPDGVNFNALGSRIINAHDPKDPQDVVTKHYMETVSGGFVEENTKLVQEATKQAQAAKVSETNAETSHQNSKKWAVSEDSPDNANDAQSSTGKTQSSRTWALYSKEKAQEAKASQDAASVSETNAKTSETKAKASQDAASVSETNAKTSETKAKASQDAAKVSETNAKASETKAKASQDAASVSETNAAESAKLASEHATDFNILKRNKTYTVGDIAFSASLPSWAYLECTTAGTTGATEPDFSSNQWGGSN